MAGSRGNTTLAGNVAIVTGAGSGLGRACAIALATEGARVAVTELPDRLDRAEETVAEIAASGGDARALPLDVRDLASIESCVFGIANELGRIQRRREHPP
jgi:NAD(P)-dependent dehydrogenase (short-subunit alcohol dehydrogenase family)